MELGGAEMSLLGLLHALDPGKVDVDLFVYSHRGPLMEHIPAWVNVLPQVPAYDVFERPLKECVRRGHWGVALGRAWARVRYRWYRRRHPASGDDGAIHQYIGNCVTPFVPRINPGVTYDLCISYLNPHNFALKKVSARKRIAWIHTDYSVHDVNTALEAKVWGAFDYIVSISEDVTKAFNNSFPGLQDKIIQIENMIPGEYVQHRSNEEPADNQLFKRGGVKLLSIGRFVYQKNFENIARISSRLMELLSIGRFCHAKNYDNVPDVARRLVGQGFDDLEWYIIGYGPDEALIRSRIEQAGMQNHVFVLGRRDNPYPYLKACDVYVQPSRYEGKSITVREAQILCKPVVITDYPTASSQVTDGVDGVIVPLDNEGCARGLARFLADHDLRRRITGYLRRHDYTGRNEVQKIYKLLDLE